jgi:ribose 5-phosphate isomerase A
MAGEAHSTLAPLGKAASRLVESGMKVGLGTGRAATAFVEALAERVRASGLEIVGVPTSEATRALAERLGLRLATLAEVGTLDLTVDGADEVSPALDLVKGLGGALVREKIVAASSRRLVIVVGADKLVERLGVRTPLPVEVVPFGRALCERRVAALGGRGEIRGGATPFVSDNGNFVLDCRFPGIADPAALDRSLREIPGVVGTGLFVGMADRVLVQDGETIRTLERVRAA